MFRSLKAILLAGLVAAAAFAQTSTSALGVRATTPDALIDLVSEGTLNMPAAGIGSTYAVTLTVTNRLASSITLNSVLGSGSTDFVIGSVPDVPLLVPAGGIFAFNVVYTASTSLKVNGRIVVNYNVGNTVSNFNLNLTGVAPEFGYSYIVQGGNSTPIVNGGTILFPQTNLNTTLNATVVVTNRGSYQGVFKSATVSGDAAFASANVPLVDSTIDAGKDIRFLVAFTPTLLDTVRGGLSLATADKQVSFAIQGSGLGALYTYESVAEKGPAPLVPNQVLALPDALVGGDKTSVVVRFKNTGNADGKISVISVGGAGFSLSEVPILPLTLTMGQTVAFTVNFLPTVTGRAQGRLRIGADDFELSSNGLGSLLTYGFVINNVTTAVLNAGAVNFTPAVVGGSSTLRFTISNTGNQTATISSIGLAAPSTIFTLVNVPSLPLNLAANASTGFTMTFTPVALGTTTATLRVDNHTFTLSGAANAPPPLPEISFEGASGAQEALQQPAVGLSIARAYPLNLTGTLALSFSSEVFSNDPAVQFATGGRTVTFTIPANATRAVFPNNQNTIRIQTGSVAGTITLTPTINTTDGGIPLTPATPPQQNLTIAQGAPRILGVTLGAKTANTISIIVSGYATNRSVTQLQLNFTPTTGETVQTSQITLPAEAAFLGYYGGAASAPFGSLFSVTIPLTLAGDIKNVLTVADTIQSVSVTVTNRLGTTSPVSLALR